jgi:hypothetical protein
MEAVSHFKLYVMHKDVMNALASPNGTTIRVHSQVYSTTFLGASIVMMARSFARKNSMPNIAANAEMMQLAFIIASRDGETEWRSSV